MVFVFPIKHGIESNRPAVASTLQKQGKIPEANPSLLWNGGA
jgi:hypothetical protein